MAMASEAQNGRGQLQTAVSVTVLLMQQVVNGRPQ